MKKFRFFRGKKLISLLLIFILKISISGQTQTKDPFLPFLTGKPPQVVKILHRETTQGIKIEHLVFLSRPKSEPAGKDSEIYAAIFRPADGKNYPGLLVLHGGSGAAENAKGLEWARRGYVVVAPDLPGIGAPAKISYSGGDWKSKTPDDYISASPDAKVSPIFDGVLAALQSFYLLRAQSGVIKEKIGIIGYAWGGYAATMVAGLVGREAAAIFSVFGTGFYDVGTYWQGKLDRLPESERDEWLRYLDAGRRAPQIKARYFLATSTNHPYFHLLAAQATLKAIAAPKNQLFAPNATVTIPLPGGMKPPGETSSNWTEMEKSYFAFNLKGTGEPFPVIKILSDYKQEKDIVRVRFSIEGTAAKVEAYYNLPTASGKNQLWRKADIVKVETTVYEAIIPIDAARAGANWYALSSSPHPATVSSPIAELPRLK